MIDFTDLQGNVTELGRFLAEELSVALVGDAKAFEVIDRTHLKALLREHKLASTGLIDPQTARQLGKIAGVDALVTGTLTAFGDSVRLSVKALDTESAKILGAATAEIAKTKAIEELLAKGVGEPPAQPQPAPTSSLSAKSGPASSSMPLPVTAAGASFRNDFLAVTARPVGIAHEGYWYATVTLVIENISQEEQFLGLAWNSAGLSDNLGWKWGFKDVSGLPTTGSNNPRRDDLVRLPPGGRQTVIATFYSSASSESSKPALVSVSMMCWRLRDSKPERVSVGVSDISVSK